MTIAQTGGDWTPARWWDALSQDGRIAAALQANARISYRDLAGIVGCSESTAARRVKALVADGLVRSTVVVDTIRCGLGIPVSVHFDAANGSLRALTEHLVSRQDVRLAALVTGRYAVLAEFVVPTSQALAGILMDELGDFGTTVATHSEPVLREFKGSREWARTLVPGVEADVERREFTDPTADDPQPLDAIEQTIVTALRADGRLSLTELSQVTGLSETAVRHRLDGMFNTGRVHPVTLVDAAFLGFESQAFVWLSIRPGDVDAAARILAARPETRYLAATAGEADLFLEIVVPNQNQLYRFRTDVLGRLDGIVGMRIAIDLQTFKRAFLPVGAPAHPTGPEHTAEKGQPE